MANVGLLLTGAILLSGVLTSCVAPQPVQLTCQRMGLPVATGQEVVLSDFSVTAPRGGNWCKGPRGKGTATFVTSPLLGQTLTARPSEAAMRHSLVLQASVVQLDQQSISNQRDLTEFARAFLGGEYFLRFSENGVQVGAPSRNPRFTVQRVDLLPDPTHADVCVRFNVGFRERDNPAAPGVIFEQHDFGALCRLRAHPDRLGYMGLSERHMLGQPADPSLFSTLTAGDAEAFLNSFRAL